MLTILAITKPTIKVSDEEEKDCESWEEEEEGNSSGSNGGSSKKPMTGSTQS